MKPEHLETLLLDRALGELSPEVEALLDSYLAGDPTAVRQAAALADTVAWARHAVAVPIGPLPDAEVAVWRRAERASRRWAMAGDCLKLAAAVLVGFGMAFAWNGRTPTGGRPGRSTLAMGSGEVRLEMAIVEAPPPAPAFWSTTRLVAEARRKVSHDESGLPDFAPHWLAPAKQPAADSPR